MLKKVDCFDLSIIRSWYYTLKPFLAKTVVPSRSESLPTLLTSTRKEICTWLKPQRPTTSNVASPYFILDDNSGLD